MTVTPNLAGRRILIVEDEFLLADTLAESFARLGAVIVGPAPSVETALALIDAEPDIDVAILDANLGGELSVPVAEALSTQDIPFLLATGYDEAALPPGLRGCPRCQKPVSFATWVEQLGLLLR